MLKSVLRLHLKREYWQAIRDGKKTEEYRLVKPYWEKRLVGREYDEVHLLCGYPPDDGTLCLVRKWNGYRYKLIQHPEFGGGQVQVFAIDVSEVGQ